MKTRILLIVILLVLLAGCVSDKLIRGQIVDKLTGTTITGQKWFLITHFEDRGIEDVRVKPELFYEAEIGDTLVCNANDDWAGWHCVLENGNTGK
jgi:hypothetical protein